MSSTNVENLISLVQRKIGYPLTQEQIDIVEQFVQGKNIFINAGPGVGKSATITILSIIADAMKKYSVNLAFNVKIAEKNSFAYNRFNINGVCWTTHQFADLVARTSINWFQFDNGNKWKMFLKQVGLTNAVSEERLNIILANCPITDGKIDYNKVFHLGQIFFGLAFTEDDARNYYNVLDSLAKTIQRGNYLTRTEVGIIPTLYGQKKSTYSQKNKIQFPIADVIFLDEALDSTISTIEQIWRYNPKAQIVFVGDTRQQIYNWAGAYPFILDIVKEKWQIVEMPLSLTFRCKSEIVAFVNGLQVTDYSGEVRQLNQLPLTAQNEGGTIDYAGSVSNCLDEINSAKSTMVLSRKNATALGNFLLLLQNGIEARLLGLTISQDLYYVLGLAKKLNLEELIWAGRAQYICDTIREIVLDKFVKHDLGYVDLDKLQESVDTLNVLFQISIIFNVTLDSENDLLEFVNSLETRFANSCVVVSTTHKIKGEEAELVIVVDYSLFPYRFKEMTEIDYLGEIAILFVALTRAIDKLILVG